jgi:hypothetical protein
MSNVADYLEGCCDDWAAANPPRRAKAAPSTPHSERCEIALAEVGQISDAIVKFIASNPKHKRSRILSRALKQCDATMELLENGY